MTPPRSIPTRKRLRAAYYDAAATTRNNSEHWTNASSLSANTLNSPVVRAKLRDRARLEVANSTLARHLVTMLALDTIGDGPRLQVRTDDEELNTLIEAEFTTWTRQIGLPEKLRTMRMAKADSGEAFLLHTRNPALRGPIELDIRLLECDRVESPWTYNNDPTHIDGIDFDQYGNPVRYFINRTHPGDPDGLGLDDFEKWSARSVIHYFEPIRPEQRRGIPDLTPALPLFALRRRFTLATLHAAEGAASFTGVLTTDAPPNGEDIDDADDRDEIEIVLNQMVSLPAEHSLTQLRAEHPNAQYADFIRAIDSDIARALGIPINLAQLDSSDHNYASGRLDHQTYDHARRVSREHIARTVLDRIFADWLEEAQLAGVVTSTARELSVDSLPHEYLWMEREQIDVEKTFRAYAQGLEAGFVTFAEIAGQRGRDWQWLIRQRNREKILAELDLAEQRRAAGLPDRPTPPPQTDDTPSPPEEEAADNASE